MRTVPGIIALAAVLVTAAGCSPGPGTAQVQRDHARLGCRALASATATFGELGGINGLSGNTAAFATSVSELASPPAGFYSARFTRDLQAVLLHGSTPAAVSTLAADCARAGVRDRIWPQELTG